MSFATTIIEEGQEATLIWRSRDSLQIIEITIDKYGKISVAPVTATRLNQHFNSKLTKSSADAVRSDQPNKDS